MSNEDFLMRRLRKEIAGKIDRRRPDRYYVSDSTEPEDYEDPDLQEIPDDGWLDEIGDEHANRIPVTEAQKRQARTIVRSIEESNLRRGNAAMRRLWEDRGQLELGPLDGLNYPLSIERRKVVSGERPRVRQERVRVGAMTPGDLELWASQQRRAASREYATREQTFTAAENIAEEMRMNANATVDAWADDNRGDSDTNLAAD